MKEASDDDSNTAATVSKWAAREDYFFNQGSNIAFWSLYVSLNVGMAVWAVWQFTAPRWSTDSDILRITLPIARAGGRLVTLNTALILMTGSKYLWTLIRQYTVIPLGFPVDNMMLEYHRNVAINIIFSGCVVHVIPQIINYATKAIVILDNKPMWTFGDDYSSKQLLITGSLLFIIFSMMFVTTLQKVRQTKWGFRIFWTVHMIGICTIFPLLIIHGTMTGHPIMLFFSILPLGMYIADVIARRFVFVSFKAGVISWETHEDCGERVTKLELLCSGFDYTPGQYAEIQIPSISATEWHPFTIASSPCNKTQGRAVFYIKAVGRWTNALYDMVEDVNKTGQDKPIIHVRGPHGAPAQNYFAYKHLVVIGSGIGVTPLLAIWQHLTNEGTKLVCMPCTGDEEGREGKKVCDKETEQQILERFGLLNINSTCVVSLARVQTKTFRGWAAYYASVMESMTVNICLFSFSVLMETGVFSVWVFNLDKEAAIMQIAVSGVVLFVFLSKMVMSIVAYGPERYCASLACILEMGIVFLDASAIASSFYTIGKPTQESVVASFSFFAAFVFLLGVRIFQIFHSTAHPPKISGKRVDIEDMRVEKIHSVTGVWVSKFHSSMSFASVDLLNTLATLPPVFSLELFGTREKKSESGDDGDNVRSNDVMRWGRPDWNAIFHREIAKAHAMNPEGSNVGVFFCGAPAIARVLQTTAQEVTAQHQHTVARETGKPCTCRIQVHKENF